MGQHPVTKIRLSYIHEYRDRHGRLRRYARLPGRKKVVLPGVPGSPEFMAAYEAALAGDAPPQAIGSARTKPGTVNAAVASYFGSVAL